MFKKYTVANWMEEQGIPHTTRAARYEVGQKLTFEQAEEIISMIAQGFGFEEEHPGRNNEWRRGCDPYRKVIFAYAKLIEARKKWGSNWDHMLWVALDDEDRIACNEVSRDHFAYKFNMVERLEEIRRKQEDLRRNYVVSRRMRRWL